MAKKPKAESTSEVVHEGLTTQSATEAITAFGPVVEKSVETVEKPQLTLGPIGINNLIGQLASQVEFGVGAHLMGSSLTLAASRGSKLEISAFGVLASSSSTGRIVLLPWANLKAIELQKATMKRRRSSF